MRPQVVAQAEGEAAQPELGRRVERCARGRRLAGDRGDEDEVPVAALLPCRGASSRAIRTGDSRLTRRARPISSWLKPSSRPDAGRPALATSTSTSPASAASLAASPGSARSETIARWPSPGSEPASSSSSAALRELRTSVAPRSASAVAIARPRPPVAPVSRAVLPRSSMPKTLDHRLLTDGNPPLALAEPRSRRRRGISDDSHAFLSRCLQFSDESCRVPRPINR